jgi:energy-coupling factor transport system ATP-binding protein
MMDNAYIKINNLSFSFDESKDVIKDLSLELKLGKFYCILGHNGSGKSTLAKLIAGLLPFNRGSIEIAGIVLNDKNVYAIRSKIGMVFQNPDNQFMGSSVADDIAFGLENRCIDPLLMEGIINEYAKKVSMEKYLDKDPSQLSGGQKQRIAIAGVLALHPDILIFDEATSMLDPSGRYEINNLIKESKINNPSLTIISITHDLNLAMQADEIIILDQGKIVCIQPPLELFTSDFDFSKHNLALPILLDFQKRIKKELELEFDVTLSTSKLKEILWPLISNK